jgi:hypothetical protein
MYIHETVLQPPSIGRRRFVHTEQVECMSVLEARKRLG